MEDTSPFEDVTFEEVTDEPATEEEEPEESPPENEEEEVQDEPDTESTTAEEEETQQEEEEQLEDEEEVQSDQEEDDEEETEEEEEVSVIDALKAQTGFETDKDYEDSLEGASEFVNDAAQQQAEQQINQVLESLPEDVQTYMNYRANGGDPDEFFQSYQRSWSDTELDEGDKSQQKTIVENRLREEGYSDEEIEQAINDYESSGVLYNEAQRSLNRLQNIEEQRQEQLVEEQQQQVQQQQEQIEEAWQEIEQTLEERNNLNGLPVPENKKDDFYNWMSEPVEEVNGQPVSQRDIAAQKADVETLLTLDYVLYLMNDEDLSFDDVIDNKAKTKKAKDLKSLAGNSKDKPSNKSGGPSGGSGSEDVDADSIPEVEELIQ